MHMRAIQAVGRCLLVGAALVLSSLWAPGALAAPNPGIGLSKVLCTAEPSPFGFAGTGLPTGCSSAPVNITPGSSVFYAIVIDAAAMTGTPIAISVVETYPPSPASFHFLGVTCTVVAGTNAGTTLPLGAMSQTTPIGPLNIAATQKVVCIVHGYFDSPGAAQVLAVNSVALQSGTDTWPPFVRNDTVDNSTPLPNDLVVTKTASMPSNPLDISTAPAVVHYTITIANNGPELYLGNIFELRDTLQLIPGSVPLDVSLASNSSVPTPKCTATAGTDCLGVVAPPPPYAGPFASTPSMTVMTSTPQVLARWRFPSNSAGHIASGGVITLEYDLKVVRKPEFACIMTGDGLINTAHIVLGLGNFTIGESGPNNVTNDTAAHTLAVYTGQTLVDPQCYRQGVPPIFKLTKTVTSASVNVPWGSSVTYNILIHNLTTAPQSIQSITDFIEEGPATPLFQAQETSANCTPVPPPGVGTGVQQLQGYYSTKAVWNRGGFTVPGSGNVLCTIVVHLFNQSCDSWAAGLPDLVTDIVRLKYLQTIMVGTTPTLVQVSQYAIAEVHMAGAPKCPFLVSKTATTVPNNQKIVFGPVVNNAPQYGPPFTYVVKFSNISTTTAYTVGSLVDAVRIVQPTYAVALPLQYKYTCVPSGTPSITNYTPSMPWQSVSAAYTSQPAQGVRLISMTNVVFPKSSMLTCTVTVQVQRPATTDPYCLSAVQPQLQNVAVMDISSVFNPNLNWPPTSSAPLNWADPAPLSLPRCFRLVISKVPNPLATTNTGPAVTYSVSIKNFGDTLSGSMVGSTWTGPVLTDVLNPSMPMTVLPVVPCGPATSDPCQWLPPLPNNPIGFTAGVRSLPHNGTLTFNGTVQPVPPFPLPQMCNTASYAMSGTFADQEWYNGYALEAATTPQPTTAQPPPGLTVCPPVVQATVLGISKETRNLQPAIFMPNMTFPVNVHCSLPPTGSPAMGASVTLTPGAAATPVTSVPVGSTCTIQEIVPAIPQIPACHWIASLIWDGVFYPNPAVVMNVSALNPHQVLVHNDYVCGNQPLGQLKVQKTVINAIGAPASSLPASYAVNVKCSVFGTVGVPLMVSATQATPFPGYLPANNVCSVSEPPPPPVTNLSQCPTGSASWATSYSPPVTIAAGLTSTLTVTNTLHCN